MGEARDVSAGDQGRDREDHRGGDAFVIDGNVSILHPVAGDRTATHRIEIKPVFIGDDVVETAVRLLLDHRADFRELRQRHKGVDYIPGVVVVNSVINAIRLEDRLVEEGFDREELLIIRGLSSRGIRQRDDRKTLAIGTAAIEVGIDFKCDYLVFEASEAASFMQRFGRVGRHQSGTAYIFCPQNVEGGIEKLSPEVDNCPDLCFIQEGHKTSVSHLMSFRPHVFVVVPNKVERDVDWRLPVFECGRHLIAFDGVALLWKKT